MKFGTSNRALSRAAVLALAAGLFVLVLGARWALIAEFGTDLPEWDQWDAEGLIVLQPAAQGQLHPSTFLLPHNEHRIVLTRLFAYGLTLFNGQWDQRLEAACNAAMPAAIAVGFWLLAAPRLSRRWQVGWWAALATVYAVPMAWENVLMGFDSQQFFLIGLSLAGVVLLPFAEPYRARWWLGATSVLLALGSMASGFFAAVIVAGMLTWQLERARRPLSAIVPGLVVCAVAIATGVMTRFVVAGHAQLKAQSASDFGFTLVKALGWPAYDFHWNGLGVVLFVPWGLVVWRVIKVKPARPEVALHPALRGALNSELLAGLGLWVVAQVLATAYARGAGGPSPAFRYMDTLIIGNLVNLLCLHALWNGPPQRAVSPARLRILTTGWIALFATGVAGECVYVRTQHLPSLVEYHRYCEQNVRNYLATRDPAYLHHSEIPYPDENLLRTALDLPALADRLPASVRRPVALAAQGDPRGFLREDSRVPEQRNPLPSPGAGMPAALPVLTNAVSWGSYRAAARGPAAEWRSAPVQVAPRSWLKFLLAGTAGADGQSLTLRDPDSNRLLAEVRPDRTPGNSWRAAYVPAPAGRFVVAATSASATGWMAFSQPVEVSLGSLWARRVVGYGRWIALGGGLASMLVWALVLWGLPRESALGTTRSTTRV